MRESNPRILLGKGQLLFLLAYRPRVGYQYTSNPAGREAPPSPSRGGRHGTVPTALQFRIRFSKKLDYRTAAPKSPGPSGDLLATRGY